MLGFIDWFVCLAWFEYSLQDSHLFDLVRCCCCVFSCTFVSRSGVGIECNFWFNNIIVIVEFGSNSCTISCQRVANFWQRVGSFVQRVEVRGLAVCYFGTQGKIATIVTLLSHYQRVVRFWYQRVGISELSSQCIVRQRVGVSELPGFSTSELVLAS